MNFRLLYLTIITAIICCACTNRKTKYVIGVSQCSEDIWRDWQNSEMLLESTLHDGVELRFATARDDSKRQILQIDSLVESGIQLLIVAPNQLASVTPAINRAYDQGIPVIVFERKTDSPKYTAFMSADNYEIGHTMGEYVEMRLHGKGHVMEILGLKGSSPAEERHKGFIDALKDSGIEIVASLQSDWTEEKGYEVVKNYKGSLENIDLVFAHNDRSALGARKAFQEAKVEKLPLFCGIDGLPGKNGGIQMVRDDVLDASYIYPTRGDQLLQLALAIRDEVLDLEANGINIIQIDEAALREKLPIRRSDWNKEYLDFAIPAFRLVHAKVKPETQIHTHMCYSEFTDIIPAIDAMDADVITFEASRSDLLILDSLKENHFKTEVGPGVYDIHSPRVPSVEEIVNALSKMREKIEDKKLWVNPDCGLKTRGDKETKASLINMVRAAKILRDKA